jgi:hypothetical protein
MLSAGTADIMLTRYNAGGMVGWNVEVTDEFAGWYTVLSDRQQKSAEAAVEKLEEVGPGLGRRLVGEIKATRIKNLKELIPPGGNLRILFVFDPPRTAILLLGGDKSGRWAAWYREAIPAAEALYDRYLAELDADGLGDTKRRSH